MAAQSGNAAMFIYDMIGKIVYKEDIAVEAGENNYTLNAANNLAKGMYLTPINDNQRIHTIRIAKQ